MDAFGATRLAVGAGFLAAAAASDLRTRRVRDPVWLVLGSVGLGIAVVELAVSQAGAGEWTLLGSAAILFYAIFFGKPLFEEEGFHASPIRVATFLAAGALFFAPIASSVATGVAMPQRVLELYTLPVMIVVFQVFWRVRLLHGGADAKGLIALTLLVPTYPVADPFPLLAVDPRVGAVLRTVFPFSLTVWVDAAVLSLTVPLALALVNAARRDLRFPHAFLGYRAPLDPFPAHAWLMERITDRGEHVLVLFPKRGVDPSNDIARLRARGIERAWVTPQTPFMIPLFLGFLVAFLVGNLLVGILGLAS